MNDKIYGDAIKETSKVGADYNSWYNNPSAYPHTLYPFFIRGSAYRENVTGSVGFSCTDGNNVFYFGFRCILI